MFDDGDDDMDFAAIAAIEEQALAARGGGGGGASAAATVATTTKTADNSKTVTAVVARPSLPNAATFSASVHPAQPVVDLTDDSPTENHDPAGASAVEKEAEREKAGETVTMNVDEAETTTTEAAAPLQPPQPPPARHLTLADVAMPPDLAALPWLNTEIKMDRSAARHWLAPVNPPPRPYQASIAATALLHNTLVCLPTGLGKTMVASIVMSNFARWFPAPAKVVFVAPTRPLVAQQVQACSAVMGVSSTKGGEAVELTGSSATPAERAAVWDDASVRFVFTTPQAFRNDLSLGVCPAHRVVCVVVDECHRCVGRSDGAVALKLLGEKLGVAARVVGLSATPGSTRAAVQEVLTNTNAARIEFRAEGDESLKEFVHQRSFEKLVVPPPPPPGPARAAACRALRRSLAAARSSAAAAIAAGSRSSSSSSSSGPALSSSTMSLLSTQGLPCDPETAPRATLAAASKRAERAAKEARAAAAGGGGNIDDNNLPLVVARALEAARHLRAAALLAGARDAIDAYGVRGGADYLAAREGDAAAAGLCSSSAGGSGEGGASAVAAAASSSSSDNNPEFRALFAATVGSGGDPKLAALLRVLEKHFGRELERKKTEEEEANDEGNAAAAAAAKGKSKKRQEQQGDLDEDRTRAIVFASLRETVAVIVRNLRAAGYDARPFVGQGTTTAAGLGGSGSGNGSGINSNNSNDASGSGGMRQAEQAATLAAFRAGSFPVLVATCVGEEGLDVPAVDLCVCFDAAASPLRGVQRAGRAGRARPGAVVSLLSSGREEAAATAAAAACAELHGALRAQAFELARRAPRMLPREFVPTRLDVDLRPPGEEGEKEEGQDELNAPSLAAASGAAGRRNVVSSSRRAAAAAANPKGSWGKKGAAGSGKRGGAAAAAAAAAPLPPQSPSQQRPRNATVIDDLLFPADTAPVVRLAVNVVDALPRRQLVVDPPPAALVAAVEADEEEEEETAAAAATATAKTPSDFVAAAASRLTQVLSVSQRATTGSKGDADEDGNDLGGGGGGDTDNEFGNNDNNGWLDAGGWGDDEDDAGAGLDGGWDLQQSLSSAGGFAASAERQQQQQVTERRAPVASAAVAACRQRVLLDSASPARVNPRRRLERSLGGGGAGGSSADDDSPAAARPRRRLLKKRRTSRAGAQAAAAAVAAAQQQRRRAPNAAAAAAFFDTEAGLSDDDDAGEGGEDDDDGEEEGSYESSFLDDGTQPEEDEEEEVEDGGRRQRRPRRLSDELAAYRARMVQDAGDGDEQDEEDTPTGNNGGMGRRRMRRLMSLVDGGEERELGEEREPENETEDDDYDEDDSFIATARSDGRAPSVAGPSQHNSECGVCGGLGGVAGKGPLLCCARCPTAVHARCVSKNSKVSKSKSGFRDDWLCAICSDD